VLDARDAAKAEDLGVEVAREGAAAWTLQTTLDDLQTAVDLRRTSRKSSAWRRC
jgi:hypothetical protein